MTASAISLCGSVGVSAAEKLHANILETLQTENVVAFDCQELQDFDASLLQLMLSAKAHCELSEVRFELQNLSTTHQALIEQAGAGDLLSSLVATESGDVSQIIDEQGNESSGVEASAAECEQDPEPAANKEANVENS